MMTEKQLNVVGAAGAIEKANEEIQKHVDDVCFCIFKITKKLYYRKGALH